MIKKVIVMMALTCVFGVAGVRAEEASDSAIVLTPTEAVKENITEVGSSETIYRLAGVLEGEKETRWNGINTVKKIVLGAVDRGVPANTIVLLLLLPLVATIISLLHYVFGLSGYGIFMPTMIAISFLATGVFGGLVLFALILAMTMVSRLGLKGFKLHFLTSRTINLMFISLATFGLMMGTSYIDLIDVSKMSIFPVLFMILLAEEFTRTQLLKSKKEAKKLMLGTLFLASIGAGVMNIRRFQELVLLNPDAMILFVLAINLLVGNYKGIRLSEIGRFKAAIREVKKKN
jgi:hypothetical protein